MVYLRTAIKTGFRIAGRIDKKYNLNKIFVDKYVPPGYRKTANRLIDIAGAVGGGYGIYRYITDDTLVNGGFSKIQPRNGYAPSKPYKTRSGPAKRYSSRYSSKFPSNRYRRCSCPRKY